MQFELNHLKYFYATVKEGGVAAAADSLYVGQPVVSKMLKSLEEDIGQPLFYKRGRRKVLTDYGQLLFRRCEVIFNEVEQIKKPRRDIFNIGAAEPIANHVIPNMLLDFKRTGQDAHVNVFTSTQSHMLELVLQKKLDLVYTFYMPVVPEEIETVNLSEYRFYAVSKNRRAKTLQNFIGSREIDDSSTHRFPTLDLLKKKQPRAKICYSSNCISLHKQLALKGAGVAIMPEFMVARELKSGCLIDVFPGMRFSWPLIAFFHQGQTLDSVLDFFLNPE